MAAETSLGTSQGDAQGEAQGDDVLESFLSEVKSIEAADSRLTPAQQIDRLNRPGASYANLNPFAVLQVTADTAMEDIKKQFRRLSILVHPDKNPDDALRSQVAFDAVVKAWKVLENEEGYKRCLEIVEEAKAITEQNVKEKKKKLRKEGKSTAVDEDDPEKMKASVYSLTMKLFADLERKRKAQEQKNATEKKRKHLDDQAEQDKEKEDKEWQKNFEASRSQRVDNWRSFQTKKSSSTAEPTAPTLTLTPTTTLTPTPTTTPTPTLTPTLTPISAMTAVPVLAVPKSAQVPVVKSTSSGAVKLGVRPLGLKVPKHKVEQRH